MNQKMTSNIKYLVISDVHLGHHRTTTKEIIRHLDIFFSQYRVSDLSGIDILFIAGDLFDRLLDFNADDIYEITAWLNRLMRYCGRNKIKLRILEGTPSHDWKQSAIANTLLPILDIELDFKYISTLHIERMTDLELDILYVPDEWNSTTDTTLEQVKELLIANNLNQVDIAIMHGMFHHQCNWGLNNLHAHDAASYLGIVRHYISIGHIHSFSVNERIIAQGSFDRIGHNEEEPKGAVLITLDPLGDSYAFIENKEAKIYKTINIGNRDMESANKYIDKILAKLPELSYIRIKAKKQHPIYAAFEELKKRFLMFNFSKQSLDEDDEVPKSAEVQIEEYRPITITADNVITLILSEIQSKQSLDISQIELLRSELELKL